MRRRILTCTLLAALAGSTASADQPQQWDIDSQQQWQQQTAASEGLELQEGLARPTGKQATWTSKLRRFDAKRSAAEIVLSQWDQWNNWEPTENLGPVNLGDAPVMLSLGPDNYWMFGRYRSPRRGKQAAAFQPEPAELEGFDMPLQTTPFQNQFDAPGGLKPRLGGYHAWQSKDMVNWVHHGPITEKHAAWMTTAEYADGKAYFYYDFPNDQDPHVYVDDNLFDGLPGEDKGMAYDDPSHGSDCGIIRDSEGRFHLILEDWSPINARTHAWDSPLAAHAVSDNGIDGFKLLDPPVDHRTQPTGRTGTYTHPHWVKENPERFKTNVAEYQIHEPEQNAYGDWAAIAIGGQYYLFCDFDPADSKQMSVGRFISSDINKPFQWCGHVGKGHPDPDVMFAKGQFYLATQQDSDFVSPGPWVESVRVRVGVDTDNDAAVDQWTEWQEVKERYDHIPGFAKQIAREPARLGLDELPAGYGFQVEVKIDDQTENESKPVLDAVTVKFES
nr:hypothetical protein [Roseimaritima sediminicola]